MARLLSVTQCSHGGDSILNKKRRFSLTTRYVVIVGILLLAANTVLGIVMYRQSKNGMQTLIRKNMLDVTNTAAGLLDGDVMAALTEDDVGTPLFQEIADKLIVFQDNADIEFIYAVKEDSPDHYVFTVDPDPVDPGEFGEEIVVTPALVAACDGIATVDVDPEADRWGNFYSSYSPVFDSRGGVAGVVGIDFSAEWYDAQLRSYTLSIGVISVLSVLIGAFVMILITGKVRRKFQDLDHELLELSRNVDALTEEITSNPGYRESVGDAAETPAGTADGDELEALGEKIRSMQGELERYLVFVHAQAYTDPLTHVGNTNAYQEEVRRLSELIENGSADFSAVVFDIDNLKVVNDLHGHNCGNQIICGAGRAISGVFGSEHTYRIGGDEFIAVCGGLSEEETRARLDAVAGAVRAFNEAPDHPAATLSMAMGAATYRAGEDSSFRDVFVRADEAMYEDKGEHHRRMPSPRDRIGVRRK